MEAAPCAVSRPPSSAAAGYSQRSKRSFTVRASASSSSSNQSTHAFISTVNYFRYTQLLLSLFSLPYIRIITSTLIYAYLLAWLVDFLVCCPCFNHWIMLIGGLL